MATTPKKIAPKTPKKIAPKKTVVRRKAPTEEVEEKDPIEDEAPEEAEPEKLKSAETVAEEEAEDEAPEEADYLRQYQYKKVNNQPQLGGVLTDPDKDSKAERMKQFLLSQKKVLILIPLPEGTDPKVLHSVTLNGYRLDFPTNAYIDVPEQVAEVIRQSNNQTVIALAQNRIDGDSKKSAAL